MKVKSRNEKNITACLFTGILFQADPDHGVFAEDGT